MKEEVDLYDMIYEYAKEIDAENFNKVNGSSTYQLRIKADKPNVEDPYNEEDWGDALISIFNRDGTTSIHMDGEKLNISNNNAYKLYLMVDGRVKEYKAKKRKEKLSKLLNKK